MTRLGGQQHTTKTLSIPRRRPWPFWLVYVMDGSTVVRRVRGLKRRGTVRRAEKLK